MTEQKFKLLVGFFPDGTEPNAIRFLTDTMMARLTESYLMIVNLTTSTGPLALKVICQEWYNLDSLIACDTAHLAHTWTKSSAGKTIYQQFQAQVTSGVFQYAGGRFQFFDPIDADVTGSVGITGPALKVEIEKVDDNVSFPITTTTALKVDVETIPTVSVDLKSVDSTVVIPIDIKTQTLSEVKVDASFPSSIDVTGSVSITGKLPDFETIPKVEVTNAGFSVTNTNLNPVPIEFQGQASSMNVNLLSYSAAHVPVNNNDGLKVNLTNTVDNPVHLATCLGDWAGPMKGALIGIPMPVDLGTKIVDVNIESASSHWNDAMDTPLDVNIKTCHADWTSPMFTDRFPMPVGNSDNSQLDVTLFQPSEKDGSGTHHYVTASNKGSTVFALDVAENPLRQENPRDTLSGVRSERDAFDGVIGSPDFVKESRVTYVQSVISRLGLW